MKQLLKSIVNFFNPPNPVIGIIFEDTRPRLSECTVKKSNGQITEGSILLLDDSSLELPRGERTIVKVSFITTGELGIYFEAEIIAVIGVLSDWVRYEETKRFIHSIGPTEQIIKSWRPHPKFKRMNSVLEKHGEELFLTIAPELLEKKLSDSVVTLKNFYDQYKNRLWPDMVSI